MQAIENDPTKVDFHIANRYYLTPGATNVLLKITPGAATQGAGKVFVEYV